MKFTWDQFCFTDQNLQRKLESQDHGHIPETENLDKGRNQGQKKDLIPAGQDLGQGVSVTDQEGGPLPEVVGLVPEADGRDLEVTGQGLEEDGQEVKARIGFGEVNTETLMHLNMSKGNDESHMNTFRRKCVRVFFIVKLQYLFYTKYYTKQLSGFPRG